MNSSEHQPRPYDVVKGRQSPASSTAAVLGGLQGVKQRLSSESETVKIAALSEALKYGQPGWDLVFQVVTSSSGRLQWIAYEKLWKLANGETRRKLLKNIPLVSEKAIDYYPLHKRLAASQWFKAEEETRQVMLKAAGRENVGSLYIRDIEQFPLLDLQTIDQLWTKYSGGRFGFSIQKRIWDRVAGDLEPTYETFCRFGDRVGWRYQGNWLNRNEIKFDLSAPAGHLPHRPHGNQLSAVRDWKVFFLRLGGCQ